jgi:hypothetical protein
VDDEPWVTGAETCELAIALHLVGETAAARTLVRDVQHLRHDDGAYWTGWQFEAGAFWPHEHSSWTSAAVILAADTLAGGVTEAVFRGDGLPEPLDILGPDEAPADAEAVPAAHAAGDARRLGCACDPAPLLATWPATPARPVGTRGFAHGAFLRQKSGGADLHAGSH